MIDICTAGARVSVERLKNLSRTPFGVFLQAALSSCAGIVILLVFLGMIFSPAALQIMLAPIIGFNTAISGYSLLEKGGRSIRAEKLRLIAMAVLLSVTGCLALFLMHPWLEFKNSLILLTYGGSALAATFFGAWLATKNKKLNKAKL